MDPTESFIESVHRPEGECSVEELALLIAAHRRPDLDIPSTLGRLDDLAARVVLGDLESLRSALFVESGFRGNTEDYYDADNSMLDVVISRRTGIPISLSILTIAVGRRAGIDLVGIGMPGHFLVRSGSDSSLFLDPFGGGAVLDRQRCVDLFHLSQGAAARLGPEHLEPVGTFAIIERVLNNLLAIHRTRADARSQLWVARLRAELPGSTLLQRADVAVALADGGRFDAAADLLDRLAGEADPDTARSLRTARDRMRSLMN